MRRRNFNEVDFEFVDLLGTRALITELRVDRSTIPEGCFMYEIRHSDEDFSDPVNIERMVVVNFYGTLITEVELDLGENHYINCDVEPMKSNIICRHAGEYDYKDYVEMVKEVKERFIRKSESK